MANRETLLQSLVSRLIVAGVRAVTVGDATEILDDYIFGVKLDSAAGSSVEVDLTYQNGTTETITLEPGEEKAALLKAVTAGDISDLKLLLFI